MPRADRVTWPRGHVLQAILLAPPAVRSGTRTLHLLALLAGLTLAACFNPPADAVLFSCTPKAPDCPPDYTCAADGCCHRDGSDIAANLGACGLGGPGTGSPGTGSTSTGATSSEPTTGHTSTGHTSTGHTSTGDQTTGTSADSSSTGSTGGTSSATDTGSTSASTGA